MRSWTDNQLKEAVFKSRSIRQVLIRLNLIPAGGNYQQIKKAIARLRLDTSNFLGKGWAKEMKFGARYQKSLKELMVKNSNYQSYKLKQRLFKEHIKKQECEICGWHEVSQDGRIPLELDHINGDRQDHRLVNLRILCPNCHALQPTHRGCNKKKGPMAKWYTRET